MCRGASDNDRPHALKLLQLALTNLRNCVTVAQIHFCDLQLVLANL